MKKILLTVFAIFTMFAASAQIGKGTWLVSGASNMSFIADNDERGGDSNLRLAGKAGYFIVENFAVGGTLLFNKYSESDDARFGIGPFFRYYFAGKVFGGLGVNFVSEGDYSATEIPIEIGYAAFLNNTVAIEPAFNFTSYGGDDSGSSFGIVVGISVYLGR